jgi:hypothetical protein
VIAAQASLTLAFLRFDQHDIRLLDTVHAVEHAVLIGIGAIE